MALIQCHECKREISSEARHCPACGAPTTARVQPKPKTNRVALGTVWAALLATVIVIYSCSDTPEPRQKSIAELEAEREKEREFQVAAAVVRSLKNNMKNPKSFELVSAHMMTSGSLCITYRGTNSFNAIVTSHYVLSADGGSDRATTWNASCAGKSGKDLTHVKYAL